VIGASIQAANDVVFQVKNTSNQLKSAAFGSFINTYIGFFLSIHLYLYITNIYVEFINNYIVIKSGYTKFETNSPNHYRENILEMPVWNDSSSSFCFHIDVDTLLNASSILLNNNISSNNEPYFIINLYHGEYYSIYQMYLSNLSISYR
jgi:hypothetical protein